jgi:hypothetical protein
LNVTIFLEEEAIIYGHGCRKFGGGEETGSSGARGTENRALQEDMNVYRVSYLLDCYGDRGERDASL